jgi:tripartite-type tricarboxylate transporter receptor subunit TctC
VDRLNREINRALMLPSAVESIKGIGAEPTPMTPAEFGAVTKADARRFAQIIKERKIVHD